MMFFIKKKIPYKIFFWKKYNKVFDGLSLFVLYVENNHQPISWHTTFEFYFN